MEIARIEDLIVSADDFVTQLKLNGNFENLIEEILLEKLTVHAAKKQGITVTDDEVQERFDQIRRVEGLHRAQDTIDFLDRLKIPLDTFEQYITDLLYREKMLAALTTDEAIKEYFNLHSPKFDSIEISHIVLDSESKAREMIAYLEDDPDSFADMAREHSLATDTGERGGLIGKVTRGSMQNEVDAKIFNASPGDLLGPFPSEDELLYEVFIINKKHTAQLDEATARDVSKIIIEEWQETRAKEFRVEIL